jgi:hypothetical protein
MDLYNDKIEGFVEIEKYSNKIRNKLNKTEQSNFRLNNLICEKDKLIEDLKS